MTARQRYVSDITTPDDIKAEWSRCALSAAYFIDVHCQIYNAAKGTWAPFKLWDAQYEALRVIDENPLSVILKARQLGLTWLCLSYALWLMLFRPAATISIFSRRQEEADYLIGEERLRGVFARLPYWMQFRTLIDNGRHWQLSNGSVARSFPTSAGDSYTATFAFADEFDLVEDQNHLIQAVKPTIDGGGKMVLLSRADKDNPESHFKKIYRDAKMGVGPWKHVFLPWYVDPKRDARWYEDQRQDSLTRTGSTDALFESYPASDEEALAPLQTNKRLPFAWLQKCWKERPPMFVPDAPPYIGLRIFSPPRHDLEYTIGADPAEGNPTSDDSSVDVVNKMTGEQCATFENTMEPEPFALLIGALSDYYNGAGILVERNNHGHTVIATLINAGYIMRLLLGKDDGYGWLTTAPSKVKAYDEMAILLREGDTIIHDFKTYTQLSSINGSNLKAPPLLMDDKAMSFVLASVGRSLSPLPYIPSAMPYPEEKSINTYATPNLGYPRR